MFLEGSFSFKLMLRPLLELEQAYKLLMCSHDIIRMPMLYIMDDMAEIVMIQQERETALSLSWVRIKACTI